MNINLNKIVFNLSALHAIRQVESVFYILIRFLFEIK